MRYRPLLRRLAQQSFASLRQLPFDPFPIRHTVRTYTREKFRADFRAAVEVALLALPQGMAYALIAGLPIQYGLYTCAVAALIGPLFASSRFVILGPTNATSVLILSSFLMISDKVDKLASLSLLLLLMGVFLVLGAFFKLANLTRFISRSVVVGYITGAACLIIANQVHSVLGYELEGASTFFDVILQTLTLLPQTHLPALLMGVMTIGVWWAFEKKLPRLPAVALSLVVMSVIGIGFDAASWHVVKLHSLPFGQWPLTLPAWNFTWFSQLLSVALALAFFATVEGTSIAKSLANRKGDQIDNNQEMFSYGLANIGCAFLGGMPSSGSLTRSALNWASGAVTSLSSFWSGLLCVLALLLLGPFIGYIPLPALAVLVIITGIPLINTHQIRIATRSTRSDAVVFVFTFLSTLVTPLDFAIYLGIATSIALYLRKAGQPKLCEYTFDAEGDLKEKEETEAPPVPHVSIIHVEGELFFGASELFRDEIRRVCRDPHLKVVILRLKNAHHLDASSVMAIEELIKFLQETDRHLIISGAGRDVYRVLRNSGVLQTLGKENFFLASPYAPNVSTRRALLRAQKLLGLKSAPVRIYYDPQFQKEKPIQGPTLNYEI